MNCSIASVFFNPKAHMAARVNPNALPLALAIKPPGDLYKAPVKVPLKQVFKLS